MLSFLDDDGFEAGTQGVVQGAAEVLSEGEETCRQRIAQLTARSGSDCVGGLVKGARNAQVMDEALVRFKTWTFADLQNAKGEEFSLGRHRFADFVSGHRATEQERRFLLQAVPSAGSVDMGSARTRKGNDGRRCAATSNVLSHLSCSIASRWKVLDGCTRVVAPMFGSLGTISQLESS